MSTYNNFRATPGNKANLRLFLQKEFLKQYFAAFNTTQTIQNINNANDITQTNICNCVPFRANTVKQGYNDPSQNNNIRISSILKCNLGGKTTFGNFNQPIILNYLDGYQGQPGGIPRPLRNTF
jgi:hypothetical protein